MLLPLALDYLAVESGGGKAIVVISPLIALMEDQVVAYSAKGIKATYTGFESDMGKKASVNGGAYQLVFSPEALISDSKWRHML